MIRQNIAKRYPASVIDQLHYAIRELLDVQSHRILYFAGHINEALLEKAVRLTIEAEPILNCRFVVRTWRPYWETRDNPDQVRFYSIVNTTDVQREIDNFMSIPLDPCNDSQVHVRIIRCDDFDALCIKMNHMVTDAAGFHEYVHMLAHTYSQLLRSVVCVRK